MAISRGGVVARLDRCCKHVGDSRRALAKDMGVDPERDSRVRMSETVGDHMDGHAGQQEVRGMKVPQIVESCHRKSWHIRREIGVVRPDDLCHERRHAVGVDRQAVHGGEHMAGLGPGVAESQLILNLAAAEGTQNVDGPSVQAHDALSPALRGALNPLADDDPD